MLRVLSVVLSLAMMTCTAAKAALVPAGTPAGGAAPAAWSFGMIRSPADLQPRRWELPAAGSSHVVGVLARRTVSDDSLGTAVAVSGSIAVIGADGVNTSTGAAYVFARSGTRWLPQAALSDPRGAPYDYFGSSVAISGTTAVVAGHGAAYVYARSGARWLRRAVLADPPTARGDPEVAISGATVVVGAWGVKNMTGAVYVYVRSGTSWRREATIPDPAGVAGDEFGSAVAISGTTLGIGARGTGNGTAYVYALSGTRWQREATLPAPSSGDFTFGAAIALSDTTALIGDFNFKNATGVAYVYRRAGGQWRLGATLSDPGHGQGDDFGVAVGISGTTAVIGADAVHGAGAAYVFVQTGGHWVLNTTLPDPRNKFLDAFGQALAMSGATVVIGAPQVDSEAGAAYLYTRSGTRWRRRATISDPRNIPGDVAGASVSISGSNAVVGAFGHDNGAGIAYIYTRSRSGWHKEATFNDPGRRAGDNFGQAVAISGTTAVIGAPAAKNGSGAVYVYARPGRRWRLEATITRTGSPTIYSFGQAVALSAGTIVIGSGDHSYSGIAFVYARLSARWHLQVRLPDPIGGLPDNFGAAVAISGNTMIIGAPGARNFAGTVVAYVRHGNRWRSQGSISDPNRVSGDNFGATIALSGAAAVIGANGVKNGAGAAYIYGRSATRWHQQAALTNPRNVPGLGFAGAVAISGIRVLVSGLSVSGLSIGPRQCGRAFEYIYTRHAWRERARVADPRCRSYDEFGYSLAISAKTAMVGAPGAYHDAGTVYAIELP